jgi:hypothetical protein
METVIIPVSYTLKQVKSIADLRTALNGQVLVMYTRLEPYQELDARKKHLGGWPKLFLIKFNEQGEMVYHSGVAADFKYWSDITGVISPNFHRYKGGSFRDEYEKGEENLFNLFLYNRKRANTMYIVPSFIPANLDEHLRLMLSTASKILSDAQVLCSRTAVKTMSYRDTLDKKGRYKRIKDTAVAIRSSYPTAFIKYTLKKEKYSFDFDYGKQYALITQPGRSGYDIRSACQYSNYFNTYNHDYTILHMKQKDVRQLHSMLETAAKIHAQVRTEFHAWLKTIPQPTLK